MSAEQPTGPEHRPDHPALRLDAACDRFEAAWREGKRPRIEDFLGDVVESERAELLRALLDFELDFRREAGQKPSAAEYRGRFLDSADLIDDVFDPEPSRSATIGRRSSRPDATTTPPVATGGMTDNGDPSQGRGTRVHYFGDYELIRELGRGGMGVVYKARQISLNRPVALKMIKSAALASDDELRRFQNEAEAVALLDHPHIVPILEVGNHDGQRYFSMKLIAGASLDKKLADYAADPRAAARLLKQAAEAVHHAHQRGILHRDLKPSNILLDERGEPYVTDFGLAKRVEGDSELTHSGAIMGTPAYMAPEQASGRRGAVTTSSDVYGLGAILYALLTGRAPFGGDSVEETLEQVRESAPPAPSKINPTAPRDLEVICLECLEKDPARRYTSAHALADDLGRYLAGEPILARPVTRFERAVKWARRKPAIAALLGLILFVAALGLGGVLWQWRAALVARLDAEAQTELAKQRLQDVLKAKAKERELTELARQSLYDARMNVIQRYWEDYNGELLQQGLVEQLPGNQGGIDRRGFEWFYWQRKMSSLFITLKGHTGSVTSVAFSPDGKRLASASVDGTVKVWDTETGQEIRTLKGHTDIVMSVAFSPDGQRLVSAGWDKTVRVWDAGAGHEILTLNEHTAGVTSVAFSPDGNRLASASDDRTVKVWNAGTGQEIFTLKGHTSDVQSVAFSPDGQQLVSASRDRTVKVWDAGTGQEIRTLKGHAGGVVSVAFSPDGRRLASASWDKTVKVWDAGTGQEIRTLKGHTGGVVSVAFSPDGKRLASASWDKTVRVWDTGTGQEITTIKGHTQPVLSVAFSPDGKRLASAGWDPTVKVWAAVNGQETLTLKGHTKPVLSVAFSLGGKRLASAGGDKTVKVWDAVNGQETLTLKGHSNIVLSVAFSPDGKRLASASWDATVRVWDAATGQETLTLKGHTKPVTSVAFSPDGKRLASASEDKTVKVWDAATGQETLTLKGHTQFVASVAFSPGGKRLASASFDQTVKVWDAGTGQETLTLKGHTKRVNSVAFSPDGQRLASASSDNTVSVWDAGTGQEIRTLKGHTSGVQSVAFSPNGKRLASASFDQTVKVWDAGTGQETLTLKGHAQPVTSVAFSPDGQRLASASADGMVKVWDARPLDVEPAKPGPTAR